MLINPDPGIGSWCSFDIPTGTAIRHKVSRGDGYVVALVFGGQAGEHEVSLDMPLSVVGTVLAELKEAVKEVRAAKLAEGGDAVACLADG